MLLFLLPACLCILRGTRNAEPLVLTFTAVLCGVQDCPSLDTESLWLCSRYTSVPEVGLLLELSLDRTLSKQMEG